jgi:hypothetical protein
LAFQTRWTIDAEVPSSAASVWVLQWVEPDGFSVVVLRMISVARPARSTAGRSRREASFSMVARPASVNRLRNKQTLFMPVLSSPAISLFRFPAAAIRMIFKGRTGRAGDDQHRAEGSRVG